MKNSFLFLTLLPFFMVFCFQPTTKAQDCGCSAVLAQDKIEASSAGFEHFHILENLEEYEYDEIKKSGGAGFKYELINGSANYSEFRKKIEEAIHSKEFETGMQYDSKHYEARTNPIAYQHWSDCMRRCNQTGLLLWIQNESKNNVAVELRYVPCPGNTTPLKYVIQIQHGDGTIKAIEKEIVPNGSESISIQRKCGSENGVSQTLISANGGGYSTGWLPPSKFYCGTPPPIPPIQLYPAESGLRKESII